MHERGANAVQQIDRVCGQTHARGARTAGATVASDRQHLVRAAQVGEEEQQPVGPRCNIHQGVAVGRGRVHLRRVLVDALRMDCGRVTTCAGRPESGSHATAACKRQGGPGGAGRA